MEFFLWIFFAVMTMVVAMAKNRNAVGWLAIGFVLPIISLIVVSVMPGLQAAESMKKCPECAESVLKDAKVCKHCGNRFE